jgi:O-antigen ligase
LSPFLAVLAWGALAFGAVYPWAYWPLVAGCAAAGGWALATHRRASPLRTPLAAAFLLVAGTVLLQLVPLPRAALLEVSPAADRLLSQYDLGYATASLGDLARDDLARLGLEAPASGVTAHPLSIRPPATWQGLALFGGLALFLLGVRAAIERRGARTLALGITGLAALLSVIAIVQAAMLDPASPLVYGFWRPRFGTSPYGPFINRNHFAGWMVMAIPLALGYMYARFETLAHRVGPGWRRRLLAIGSFDGSVLILLLFAAAVMALSLVMSTSRSGIGAFVAAMAIATVFVLRSRTSGLRRLVLGGSLGLLVVVAIVWAGTDAVAARFAEARTGAEGRNAAWRDTVRIIRDFPVTGTGLNTYGAAMIVYQSGARTPQFREAHNEYLQLAAEGGLLVGVPILIALTLFVREIRSRFRESPRSGESYWLRAGAATGLIAIALQSLVEFSLQMPGSAALFAALSAVALHRQPPAVTRTADGKRPTSG